MYIPPTTCTRCTHSALHVGCLQVELSLPYIAYYMAGGVQAVVGSLARVLCRLAKAVDPQRRQRIHTLSHPPPHLYSQPAQTTLHGTSWQLAITQSPPPSRTPNDEECPNSPRQVSFPVYPVHHYLQAPSPCGNNSYITRHHHHVVTIAAA